jgi:UDP-N-acetylglucosamine 2-epimerase (non-hydrolysing)
MFRLKNSKRSRRTIETTRGGHVRFNIRNMPTASSDFHTDFLKAQRMETSGKKILTIFGTRPEVIKLAPIIQHLTSCAKIIQTINIASAQHTDLLYPFVRLFRIRIDYDLQVMGYDQTPNQVCSRVLASLDPILGQERPDLILVQGDTTTALSGALAGFHRRIPVAHVEAGLRSGNSQSPYPEEMNRRLISRLATYHFAATTRNRENLITEGVPEQNIFLTGNPVVDSLTAILKISQPSSSLASLLDDTAELKRIVLTTHRRESFGHVMAENLKVLRQFVDSHEDVALIFPVHPNPSVEGPACTYLSDHPRIRLIPPLDYPDFIALLSHAWLIVSDSGGVQEEAPTLRKPLLVLRENTERPEALDAGVARLVGGRPDRLSVILDEVYGDGNWTSRINQTENPFGRGDSGRRIGTIIQHLLVGENSHGRS